MSKAPRMRHRHGVWAEYAALIYLMLKAYAPVTMRYKTPVGEIDLVVRRGKTLVFVEVKARASHEAAAHAVHATNQSRVVRAAQVFLQRHPAYASYQVRFDVCLVAWYKRPRHLMNAFH